MIYNTPPFTVVVKKDSPIKTPKDLEGKTIGGPANDGALKLFPAFAKVAKIDASKVNITNMAPNLREQMLLRGQVDAIFGFTNTVYFSAKLVGIDPEKDLRFINYADYGMDLYSNAIVFSRAFAKENPKAVAGFVKAVNRAINDALANPEAAMDTVMKREPLLKRDVEKERLIATIKQEMSHPEIARIGFGDVDGERLKRAIAMVVEANALPRTPANDEVFDRSFLPPRAERASKL
jgi:NitT/TauT family transport system substrate-binding protein